MTRYINIENLALINNIISQRQPENLRQILKEHSAKRTMEMFYSLKDIRPGSDEYVRKEKKRAEIIAFPDHNIKYGDDICIMGRHSRELLRLTVGTYTTSKMHSYTFLVKNEFHLESVYTKFSDLFTEYHNISGYWLEATVDNMYWKLEKSYHNEYRKYIQLFQKDIKKALEFGYAVSIEHDRDMRGFSRGQFLKIEGPDKTVRHSLESLDEILEIKYYWYDDRKVYFGNNYYFDDVIEEYNYAKNNKCEE